MTTIDFNTKPYFDDFDDSKNYQKILFKPSFAVQARELTQLQTISQNQIKKLADVSLSNGDRLSPGELIYSNKISYVKMAFNSTVNITKTISSLVSGGNGGYTSQNGVATSGGSGSGLTVDITANGTSVTAVTLATGGSDYTVGDTITISGGGNNATFTITGLHAGISASDLVGSYIGNANGLKAKIIHYEGKVSGGSDPFTLYLSYLNSFSTQTSVSDSDFKFANNLELFKLNTDGTVSTNSIGKTANASATGLGSGILLKGGSYYVNGYITTVSSQTMILDKFGITPSYRVGFNVSQSFVTSDDDSSLLDNATGSTNKGAGGADRHKINLVLAKKSLTPDSTANEDFVEILKVSSGELIEKDSSLDKKLEGENKILEPYDIEIRENLSTLKDSLGLSGVSSGGSSSKLSIGISPGSIQFNGKEVVTSAKQYLTVDKSREQKTYSNYAISSEVGVYVFTRGGLNPKKLALDSAFRRWFNRIFTAGVSEGSVKVTLTEQSSDGNTETPIGYARIRNIKQHSRSNDSDVGGECKIFLTDIQLNSGKKISDITGLITGTGSNDLLICYLETDRIYGTQGSAGFSYVQAYGKDNTPTILQSSDTDRSFYPLGIENVKSIGSVKPNRVRWSGDVTIGSAGVTTATFTAPAGYYFVDNTEHEVIVYGKVERDNSAESNSRVLINGTAYADGGIEELKNSATPAQPMEYLATISGSTSTTLTISLQKSSANATLDFVNGAVVSVIATVLPTGTWTSGNSLALTKATLNKAAGVESTSRFISLDHPRVLEKNFKVYMSKHFDSAVSSPVSADDVDITDWYYVDSGMRDNFVTNGSLIRKKGYPEPTGRLAVIYFYLNETSSAKHIDVGSYPVDGGTVAGWVSADDGGTTFRYGDIPVYTSELGKKYRLSDVLDFRPTITGDHETTSVSDSKPIIDEQSTIEITDLVAYQSRIDKIYVKDDGTVSVKTGSSFIETPSIPSEPEDGLSIYNVKVLPYTYTTKDVVVSKIVQKIIFYHILVRQMFYLMHFMVVIVEILMIWIIVFHMI